MSQRIITTINITPILFNHKKLKNHQQNSAWRKYPQLFGYFKHMDKSSINKEIACVDHNKAKKQRNYLIGDRRPFTSSQKALNFSQNNAAKTNLRFEISGKKGVKEIKNIKVFSNSEQSLDISEFKSINESKALATESDLIKKQMFSSEVNKSNGSVKKCLFPDFLFLNDSGNLKNKSHNNDFSQLNDQNQTKLGNLSPDLSKMVINPFTPQVVVKKKKLNKQKLLQNINDKIKLIVHYDKQSSRSNTSFDINDQSPLSQYPFVLKTKKNKNLDIGLLSRKQIQKKMIKPVKNNNEEVITYWNNQKLNLQSSKQAILGRTLKSSLENRRRNNFNLPDKRPIFKLQTQNNPLDSVLNVKKFNLKQFK